MSTLKIDRIHHVAYRCKDAKETVEWYVKHLNMDFVLAIAEDQVPSTKAPDPYMHVFLDAGQGNVLAFFELDEQHQLFGLVSPLKSLWSANDKQQQFLHDAERVLQAQGKLCHSNRVSAEYRCLQAETEQLVFVQQTRQQVDINQVRALFQQMLAADLSAGLVVSYSGFSNQAWIFASTVDNMDRVKNFQGMNNVNKYIEETVTFVHETNI